MQPLLYRTILAVLLTTLVGCRGLDFSPPSNLDTDTTPIPKEIVIIAIPTEISAPDTGAESNISVKVDGGNGIWKATIPAQNTWLKTQIINPSASVGELKIVVSENSEAAARSALVTITSGDQAAKISVTQNPGGSVLITKNAFEVASEGENIEVEVKHDIAFSIDVPKDFEAWLAPLGTKSMQISKLSFCVKPNDSGTLREGYLLLTSRRTQERITIVQAAALSSPPSTDPPTPPEQDRVEVSPEAIDFVNAGGSQALSVSSSGGFKTTVTNGGEWLSVVSESGSEVVVAAAANAELQPRVGELKICCGEVSAVVSITQAAADAPTPVYEATVTTSQPGALTIPPEQRATIHTLTISGSLDGRDFELLSSVTNLKTLDLTGVRDVMLPSEAYTVFKKLRSLMLPAMLVELPDGALAQANELQKVAIGAGLSRLPVNVFSGCRALESLVFAAGSGLREIGVAAFFGCRKLTSLNVPQGVVGIGANAFSGCAGLVSVVLPATVREVGMSAFLSCGALRNVVIPEGVEEIGMSTFASCIALRSARLPATLKRIGSGAFGGCRVLEELECRAVEPPELVGGKGVFINKGKNCVLRVPSASVARYEAAEGWGEVFAGRVVGL